MNKNIVNIEQNNINKELNENGIVLVDFHAKWCGPCKVMSPVLDKIADEFVGKVLVLKIDIDINSELAQEYEIRSIPTVLIFKNGKKVERLLGVQSKEVLTKKLNAIV